MTRAEVFEAVDRRYPQTGIRMRPRVMKDDPGNLGFFMNPEGQGEPNCEGIFLSLELDRVKSKQYSMD